MGTPVDWGLSMCVDACVMRLRRRRPPRQRHLRLAHGSPHRCGGAVAESPIPNLHDSGATLRLHTPTDTRELFPTRGSVAPSAVPPQDNGQPHKHHSRPKKIPSRPGGGHGKPVYVCLRRLGVPPRPPLTEMEDRRATVTSEACG